MPIQVPQIDFRTGVNAPAPASYQPPRYDFGLLSGLVGDYYEGAGLQNQLAQRNAFPNGLPRDKDGNVDLQAIQDTSVKLGGVPAAAGYVPLIMGQQAGQYAAKLLGAPADQQPPPAPQPPQPQHEVPKHGIPVRAGTTVEQRLQGDSGGQAPTTVANMVYAKIGNEPTAERMLAAIKTRTGLDRGEDISPNDPRYRQVEQILASSKSDAGGSFTPNGYSAGQGPALGAPGAPNAPAASPGPPGGQPDPRLAAQAQLAQRMNNGQRFGSAPPAALPAPVPAPVPQPPPALRPQGAGPLPPVATQTAPGPLASNPQIAFQQQQAAKDRAESARLYQAAAALSGNAMTKPQSDILKARAEALDKRATEFEQSYNRSIEKQTELAANTSNKLYAGLNSQATTAVGMMPQLKVAKSILYDPQMYTGTAEHQVLGIRRAVASIAQQFPGLQFDPRVGGGSIDEDMRRSSAPQEILRKVIATNILHQVADLRAETSEMGASGSRIFQQQIELMMAAAQNGDNSIEANRFLTELSYRTARRQMEIGDMAARYVDERGQLNPRFDVAMREYMLEHPIFTREELADRRLITAPEAPQTVKSPADAEAWGNYMRLQRGDPFRVDGKIKYWHGGGPQPAWAGGAPR